MNVRKLSGLGIVYFSASIAFAGFGSTETYLASVGRVPGKNGAEFYTTIWATNLTGAPQTLTFEFLKIGQANPSPASFGDTLQPGETKVYENVVESKLGLNDALGAARVRSSGEIFVAERIYNQAPGATLGETEGLFFAGVPRSFSISAGQSSTIQGVNQGGAEDFRYNFALVETGGGSATVNVQVFDGSGTLLGQKAYSLSPYEMLQPSVGDVVPDIHTVNARITATVTSGTGSAILAGAQLANVSQDSSGFEMTFPESLLGGGTGGVISLNGLTGALTLTPGTGISITPSGSSIAIAYTGGGGAGGITSVTHDASLAGAGTGASPLSIANAQVVRSVNGLHDAVTLAAGSNVTITPSGSTLTIASSGGGGGGGLTLPFSGSTDSAIPAFQVNNSSSAAIAGLTTGSGAGVAGTGHWGVYGLGNASQTTGVYGLSGIASNETGWAGVWGDSKDSTAVQGTSANDRGVLGITNSKNAVAAIEGLNRAALGTGVLGRVGTGTGQSALGAGAGVWGDADGVGAAGVYGTGGYGLYGDGGSGGIGLFAKGYLGMLVIGTGTTIATFENGASMPVAKIDSSGKGFFDGGTQTGGADVAEFVAATSSLEPGDVVEIDVDHPGAFRRSSVPNGTAVAGVVSTDPGVSMNAHGTSAQTGPRLALAGRVPVKATIEGGVIRPGDLLVAASAPGRAMRAPEAPRPGTIIGKALGTLSEGDGVVEMLVMLR